MMNIIAVLLASVIILPKNGINEPVNTDYRYEVIENLDEEGRELFGDEEFCERFFEICEEYEMEPELIISMIKSESTYNSAANNGTCIGLMQINPKWHKDRMERLGCDDLTDPIQNVLVGVDYLAELSETRSTKYALMCYNMGFVNARKRLSTKGYSYYANSVVEYAEWLKERTKYDD